MRRRRRRGDDAQAAPETALVIPILLFLVCNFIAVMVQVTVQEQLNSATALAAQLRFQAPKNAIDPSDTRCCGAPGVSLATAGLPTGCRYAAETFYPPKSGVCHALGLPTSRLMPQDAGSVTLGTSAARSTEERGSKLTANATTAIAGRRAPTCGWPHAFD